MSDHSKQESCAVNEVSAVMKAEADVLFTDERLARQRTQILQRIEESTRPGQVIAFPNAQPSHPSALRVRPGTRWIAAAAAAGLLIGVVAGHLAHVFPVARAPLPIQAMGAPTQETLQAVSTTLSEEEFLGALEIAIETTGGSALRPLDELTPMVEGAPQ